MLDEHKEAIKNKLLEMDVELQNECYTFIVKNGKPQADENCHDDVVMADAICVQMLKTKKMGLTENKERVRKYRDPRTGEIKAVPLSQDNNGISDWLS